MRILFYKCFEDPFLKHELEPLQLHEKTSGPKYERSSWVLATIYWYFLVIKLPCGSGTMPEEKVNLKTLCTSSNAHQRNSGGG
jgi:hypothetical protein